MKFWGKSVTAMAAGAMGVAAAFFLDPRQGAKRRQKAGDVVQRQRANVTAMFGEAMDKAPAMRRKAS